MKKIVLLFPLLLILYSQAQNCDSIIVIISTYNDDGSISPGPVEIDSLQNGLVVSRNIENTRIDYRYDSLNRLTEVLTYSDSILYSYDSNSRIITTDYFHKNGTAWQFSSDTSHVACYYSIHGLDSIVKFKWDGIQLNSFYRYYYFYNPNDTLFKIQAEVFDSSGWNIDSLTFVSYPTSLPGIFRIDSTYNDSVITSFPALVTNYDSLNRIVLSDSYYSYYGYPDEHAEFYYDCNQLSESNWGWPGTHDGGFEFIYFDSLCRITNRNVLNYGQDWDGSTSYDYYYVGCSSQILHAGDDKKICKGDSVDISVLHFGGTGPFHFQWYPSQGLTSDSLLITKAFPDSTTMYVINVTDSNGLTATDTINIIVVNPPVANIHITNLDTNSVCQSAVLVGDSASNYVFYWFQNGLYAGHNSHLNITFNGIYILETGITGNNNSVCPVADDTLMFNYFTSIPLIVTLNRSCHEIYATPSVPAQIQWFFNNQLIVDSVRDTLVMTLDGRYSAIIIDSSGCTSAAAQIDYTHLSVSSTVHNCCINSCNGYIFCNVYDVNYLWSNGATTSNIQNLCSGIYSAIVTDQFGCTTSFSDTLNIFTDVNLHYVTTGTSGPFACDAIVIPVDSMNTPYIAYYSWDNSTYDYMCDSMCAGWHTVTVSPHFSGCHQVDSFYIPSSLSTDTCSILQSHTNISCNGYANGTITINSSTGSPFACFWSSPNLNANLIHQTNLHAGTYSCMMIDKNGCVDSTQITITEPAPLSATFNIYQSFCGDSCAVTVIGSGGTPPYGVHWCDGSNSNPYINCIEQCNVILTDSNHCSLSDTVIQPSVSPIIFHTISIPPSCHLCNDGSIIIIASGGVTPYLYSVDNGIPGLNDTITNLSDTAHIVCVSGSNGCSTCDTQLLLYTSSIVSENKISVFPNPFHDRTVFNFSDFNPEIQTSLIIYDMIGKIVKELPVKTKQFELQGENLPPGIYTVILKTKDYISGRGKIVID